VAIQTRFFLILPLLFLCLAFDAADQHLPSAKNDARLAVLQATEAKLVGAAENRGQAENDSAFGADPYRILHLPGTDRHVILLRNASEVVLCDGDLRIIDRAPLPVIRWRLI